MIVTCASSETTGHVRVTTITESPYKMVVEDVRKVMQLAKLNKRKIGLQAKVDTDTIDLSLLSETNPTRSYIQNRIIVNQAEIIDIEAQVSDINALPEN